MHTLATAGRPPRRWPALQVVDVGEAFYDVGVRNGWGRNSTVTPALDECHENQTLEGEFPLRRILPDKSFSTTCLTIFPIRSATV